MTPIEAAGRLLESQSTLALATAGTDGLPALAPLFYLPAGGLRLYWFSSRSSAHSRNLARNAAAAVTVYRPAQRWKEIAGVQMRGAARPVRDRALRREIAAAYVERFHLGAAFGVAMARSRLYCFEPSWVRYIDNSRRFGYKFEFTIEESPDASE